MSSKRYQEIHKKLTEKQIKAIWRCYQQAINHDGHSWVTFTDVEELVADLLEDDLR